MATLTFKTTNNETEYEALIVGLSIMKTLGAIKIEAKVGFQIVVNQVTKVYATKGEKLKNYLS